MGPRDGGEAPREVELEQEREEGEPDIGTTVFLQCLPGYDEWPADTTVQLNANISVVYSLPSVIHHLFFALPMLFFQIQQMR